ncbi:NAD(P)-dependent oxidoreductase [Streptomyces longispororuber]|uniref:NAD(P)-dependent oxidoreductase n=1 Tax=Streptomyces longispororuber TaxID=68230 RepID=UPI0033C0FEC3
MPQNSLLAGPAPSAPVAPAATTVASAATAPAAEPAPAPVVVLAGDLPEDTAALFGPGPAVVRHAGAGPDGLRAALAGADAVLLGDGPALDAAALAAAPRLKVVARAGAGLGAVDVAAATRRGVQVTAAPDAESLSTAELVVGMLVAVARNIPQAHASLTGGAWQRGRFGGAELAGRTVGLIGLGRVGSLVAERLTAFAMRPVAYDPYAAPEAAAALGVRLAPLDEVLAAADFLTVQAPLTEETRGLLGFEALRRVRHGVRLVTVADEGVVDAHELRVALKEGRVAAAALDLDPAGAYAGLVGLENVVATPRLAARSAEAARRGAASAAESVRLALGGAYGPHVVNMHGHAVSDAVRPWLGLAERLGEALTALAGSLPSHLEVTLLGALAEQDADVLELAALKGVLSGPSGHPVSLVNAPLRARERGLTVRLGRAADAGSHHSAVALRAIGADGTTVRLAGTLSGIRRHRRLTEVLGYDLELPLDGDLAFFEYPDRPGAVGEIGTRLAAAGVGIESMRVARAGEPAHALAALATDAPVPPHALTEAARRVGARHSRTVPADRPRSAPRRW